MSTPVCSNIVVLCVYIPPEETERKRTELLWKKVTVAATTHSGKKEDGCCYLPLFSLPKVLFAFTAVCKRKLGAVEVKEGKRHKKSEANMS